MTDEQITAIAREYAVEITKADAGDPNLSANELNDIKQTVADYAADVFRWLSGRCCIVEKSKLKDMWEQITQTYLAHQHITYDGARYIYGELFGEGIFPELFKTEEK